MSHALKNAGFSIHQVLNRTLSAAELLANEINAGSFGSIADFDPSADICLLCLSDDAILPVLEGMDTGNSLVLHTSGSVPMDVLKGKARRYGVLYPLQTFTRGKAVNMAEVPFLIEAGTTEDLSIVRTLADSLTRYVKEVSSEERSYLHLAAVFASNFSNHMFALAEWVATNNKVSFELLIPLIRETIAKAIELSPATAQTGPAVRGNDKIMQKHLEMLKDHPQLAEVYRVVSDSIKNWGTT
jgi:predicted short-subunit dehydrogenase-like oxidoreductase (DUF2520 family)